MGSCVWILGQELVALIGGSCGAFRKGAWLVQVVTRSSL